MLKALKVLAVALVVFALGFLSGCSTIYGITSDINIASGWAQKKLKPAQDAMEEQRVRRAAELVLEQKRELPAEQLQQ